MTRGQSECSRARRHVACYGEGVLGSLPVGVTVAIVTHNSATTIGRCLSSFSYLWGPGGEGVCVGEIVVVDNASTDSTVAVVRQIMRTSEGHRVRLVQSDVNRGWGSANNDAVQLAADNTELILLCNPDASIDETSLETLVLCLMHHPQRIAAAVPYFKGDQGWRVAAQPHMSVLDIFLWEWGLSRARTRTFVRRHRRKAPVVAVSGYPSGAMALIRRDAFISVGGFDESIFLYWDDMDFGRRLRDADQGVVACTQALARHVQGEGSALSGSSDPVAARLRLSYRSQLRYVEKWHSAGAARRLARFWVRQTPAMRRVRSAFRRTNAYSDIPAEVARHYLADPNCVVGPPASDWFR